MITFVNQELHKHSISHNNLPRSFRNETTYTSVALHIFTSGTSGLPKASLLRHARVITSGAMFVNNFGVQPNDRIYNVLPLYHSSGGVCAIYCGVLTGCAVVLKKKLSTTEFWSDCCKYNITIIQYIGELLRYLINTTPQTNPKYDPQYEAKHNVRLCMGNGIKSDVWLHFQERFNIPTIVEFYASTEGNVAVFVVYNRDNAYHKEYLLPFYQQKQQQQLQQQQQFSGDSSNNTTTTDDDKNNNNNKELSTLLQETIDKNTSGFGSVGHNGIITRFMSGFTIIKYDVDKDEIVRNAQGFCIPCAWGEPGLLISPMVNWDPTRRYSGYHNPNKTKQQQQSGDLEDEENQKKILKNCFKLGDAYFNTGDLLSLDQYGFWRFHDRIGDTFRWCGENVSTLAVENALSQYTPTTTTSTPTTPTNPKPIIENINVYGVLLPGFEGRAPMMTISLLPPFRAPSTNPQNADTKDGGGAGADNYEFNLKDFYSYAKAQVASFALPIFIRFTHNINFDPNNIEQDANHSVTNSSDDEQQISAIEGHRPHNNNTNPTQPQTTAQNDNVTGTFKNKKADLRKQGAEFYVVAAAEKKGNHNDNNNTNSMQHDTVFIVNHQQQTYQHLTPELWEQFIVQKTARL